MLTDEEKSPFHARVHVVLPPHPTLFLLRKLRSEFESTCSNPPTSTLSIAAIKAAPSLYQTSRIRTEGATPRPQRRYLKLHLPTNPFLLSGVYFPICVFFVTDNQSLK